MRQTRRGYLAAVAGATTLSGCLGGVTGGSGGVEDCEAAKTETVQSLPAPVIGDPESDVTVMAFEDFACPHCATYSLNVFPELRSSYIESGEIRYEFHDLPIPVSQKWSWAAASAAHSVQDQTDATTFFDFSKLLFENQDSYSMELMAELGDEVGASGCAVRAAAQRDTYRPVVEADREMGRGMGASGTPAVFVNGQPVDSPSLSAIERAIEGAMN